jgi:hypothetical protein
VAANEALFVDDAEDNVKAASGLGIRAHLFKEPASLRLELRRLNLL